MKKLSHLWIELRTSLWFVPTLIVTGCVLLAVGMVEVDSRLDMSMSQTWPRLFGAGAEGTRGMLEAIAGSMITVAGVVFSITIVTLSLASSQYSSRVLRNFLSDRGNQAVLGVFLGVFAYCLVVLRTIRGGEEAAFVPSTAALGAVLLAFVGIGFLIYFIHHISFSIQATQILAAISSDTERAIDNLFPDQLGAGESAEEAVPRIAEVLAQHAWQVLPARSTGYISEVDNAGILRFACRHGVVVQMTRGIGEFVIEGMPLARITAPSTLDESSCDALNGCYAIGRQRTIEQDAAFGIRQIVDIALKALSPGINDLTTARMSLDHLAALLVRLAQRRIPSPLRYHDGELRVIACGPTFESLAHDAFDEIRHFADGNVTLISHLLARLETIGSMTSSAARLGILEEQLEAIGEAVRRSVPEGRDRARLEARIVRCAGRLSERAGVGDDSVAPVSNRH